ncbi:outer membrane beta-barrel protein [Hanstruepera marina]|uniref:outer membrane beta-barrel protein n=1 Tax=Hanstruepera marina TaxID=2873265 RepID=UPI001CA65FF0|nr:outer membrane beta-barrel protein [Hanstruepera marina]
MKKLNVILLLTAFLAFTFVQAQEETEKKESKFSVMAFGGIGYGIMDSDSQPNYNVNANSAELVLNYKISDNIGLATGGAYTSLTSNAFNYAGNFYHERILIKIPLLVTFNCFVADNFKFIAHLGPYAQTIYKDEYTYSNFRVDDVYEGWNFGFQLGLGFLYDFDNCFSAGINYSGQSDFSKFETNTSQVINDEQKVKNLNTIGLIFILDF